MTGGRKRICVGLEKNWIPAYAGMTGWWSWNDWVVELELRGVDVWILEELCGNFVIPA